MYGLVNKAIRDLVEARFGTEAWNQIAAAAGFEGQEFLSMEPYDDAITYRLVAAASLQLRTEPADLLRAFGEFWIRYTATEGYGDLLDLFGATFEEFVSNLDLMHSRLGLSMPQLRPPSFEFERRDDGCHRLHYRTDREGLAPMVMGILQGLGARFEKTVAVAPLPEESEPGHTVFALSLED